MYHHGRGYHHDDIYYHGGGHLHGDVYYHDGVLHYDGEVDRGFFFLKLFLVRHLVTFLLAVTNTSRELSLLMDANVSRATPEAAVTCAFLSKQKMPALFSNINPPLAQEGINLIR